MALHKEAVFPQDFAHPLIALTTLQPKSVVYMALLHFCVPATDTTLETVPASRFLSFWSVPSSCS